VKGARSSSQAPEIGSLEEAVRQCQKRIEALSLQDMRLTALLAGLERALVSAEELMDEQQAEYERLCGLILEAAGKQRP